MALPVLPIAVYMGRDTGIQDYWAWLICVAVFGIIPVLSQEKICRVFPLILGSVWLGRGLTILR